MIYDQHGNIDLNEIEHAFWATEMDEACIVAVRQQNTDGRWVLASLAIGNLIEMPGWDGTIAMIDHCLVMPGCPDPLGAMHELPRACARAMNGRGLFGWICLRVEEKDPRAHGLMMWGRRVGFKKVWDHDGFHYLMRPARPEEIHNGW